MNYLSPIASHATGLACIGLRLAHNFYKTHTFNNNLCAVIALNAASVASYKLVSAIYKHTNKSKDVAQKEYVKTGKILLTVGTFAVGTMNSTLGWVIPVFVLLNKKLWLKDDGDDAYFTKHLFLPIRGIGQGLASQIDEMKHIVSETLFGKSKTNNDTPGILPIATGFIAFKPLYEQMANICGVAMGALAVGATIKMAMGNR